MKHSLILSTVSFLALGATSALAQTAAPAEGASSGDIVVTGSRIARRDFVAATPIVTASQESLQQIGAVNVETSLNQLPQFTPAGTERNGGRGAGQRATLNLRGLGTNRNLVLLDGRRLPPSSATGVVDVNILPTSIISGVETITGGASAVYGADAVSGVVNFKTRDSFDGAQLDLQYGNSLESDRQTRDITLTTGADFADGRGSAILSLAYSDRERLHGTERDYLRLGTPSAFITSGTYIPTTSNLPTQASLNTVFAGYGIGGNISRTNSLGFNNDGSLYVQTGALNYKGPTDGPDYFLSGGNVRHPFTPSTDIASAQERRTIFGKARFEITPHISAYGQVLYVDSSTDQDDGTSLTQFGTLATIPVTNPYIPAALKAILATRPTPGAPMEYNGRFGGFEHKGWTDQYYTSQFIMGLRGDLGIKDWRWDAYASFDKTAHPQVQRGAVQRERVQALWNAADGGNSLCAGGYNPFGDLNNMRISDQCRAYVQTKITNNEDIVQDIYEASLQGGLFELPAGEVRFSLVGGQRTETYNYQPDNRLNTPGLIEATNAQNSAYGELTAKEIAGELLIPVLAELPFAQALNLNVAYRYSDYNLAGGSSTYKADADWTVVPGLLLRGGYARAVRAPNMGEYFFAGSFATVGVGNPPAGGEPCDVRTLARINGGAAFRALCIANGVPTVAVDSFQNPTVSTGNSVTTGNLNLTPETADTYTVGTVIRPQFGPDFFQALSFTVDFYNIKVKDVIGTVDGATVLNKCFNQDGSNPTYSNANVYCQLIHRDGNGLVQLIDTPYLNLGGLRVQGIDFQIDWRHPVGPGTLALSSVIGRKLKDEQQIFATSPIQDFVGTGSSFRWQVLNSVTYDVGKASLTLRGRYYDGTKSATWITRPASPSPGVRPFMQFDVSGTYDLTEKIQLRGGLTNLNDMRPPDVNNGPGSTNGGLYDPIGRSAFLALRARF